MTAHDEYKTAYLICRIVRTLAGVLTAFVLVFAGLFTLPRIAGVEPYIVMSGSMEPAIPTGSIAFVSTADDDVKEGDIIAFRLSGATGSSITVTHRIIDKNESGWITKGDANESADTAAVRPEQVIGTYLFSIPELGYLMNGKEKELGLLLILWVLAANLTSCLVTSLLGNAGRPSRRHSRKRHGNFSTCRSSSPHPFPTQSKYRSHLKGEQYK